MKILLCYPPFWDFNLGPMLSMPLLSGMLKEQGHEVEIFDINSSFMNFVLSKKFVDYCRKRKTFLNSEIDELAKDKSKKENAVLIINLQSELRFLEYLSNSYLFYFIEKYPNIKDGITELFKEMDAKNFNRYFSELKENATTIFNKMLRDNMSQKFLFLHEWEDLFVIKRIKDFNPDIIGFSTYWGTQAFWSIKIAAKLKQQNLRAKMFLGGAEVTKHRSHLSVELFQNSIDGIIYGEGEQAFTMLGQNKPFSEIPNLIYLDENNEIKINPENKSPSNFRFYKPNYSGIKLNNYFIPKTVLQVESSRGCYWHKCEFCSFMDCATYKQKNLDDFIEEIKEYVNEHNIHHFFFTDAAIHPNYAREFSKKILENNLKIYYVTFLRLEDDFDKELLQQMYDAGLRIAMWGLETGSQRILDMYNKGTKVETNARILKEAHNIGIFNYCWTMINFPKETIDDINQSREFLTKNFDYIDYVAYHMFSIIPNSLIANKREEYGLENYSFRSEELYKPPKDVAEYANRYLNEMHDFYYNKLENNHIDISYLLLKLSNDRP